MAIEIKSVWSDVPKPEMMQEACKQALDETLDQTVRLTAIRKVRAAYMFYKKEGMRPQLQTHLKNVLKKAGYGVK